MKVFNTNRFVVQIKDRLEYNQDAIDWHNNRPVASIVWPSAVELNSRDPIVEKFEPYVSGNKKYIELWVSHKDIYTGFSGVIHDGFTDIWCLFSNGSYLKSCPYPLFKKVIK